jgi:hypothetical protein
MFIIIAGVRVGPRGPSAKRFERHWIEIMVIPSHPVIELTRLEFGMTLVSTPGLNESQGEPRESYV